MASERSKQMQQANTFAEVLASLDRIEIALGIKPKPEEPKAKTEIKKAPEVQNLAPEQKPVEPTSSSSAPQGQGTVAKPPWQGTASRQNPVRGKK